ncbi:saccharopine dehydrogenase family protein [Nocardia jinanensis]|uniref:Membrane protein n=1 Tax=Nocardia jinanensis TaxID=382504 RepID=A0A917VRF8_9NOCA|nr:saccharopine dehydrogenase NADP-binding domain-containing protein [Nocardia jinanensis]GGL06998.1 membrane protein [Nocardia jinanensis]
MAALMVYGATGYTGRMTAEYAVAAGSEVILGGRDEARVAALAAELGTGYRGFGLDEKDRTADALADIDVLLNCAGPFARTAEPLMTAAVRTGTHYLDIAAELDSYHLAEALDEEATAAGVLLLPGSGGSVAMLGCLAGRAAEGMDGIRSIAIALHIAGGMSRGSAVSAAEGLTTRCLRRVAGELVPHDPEQPRDFDFGAGPVACFPTTLPDLVTLWRATKAPDIGTYVHVSGDAFPEGDPALLPEGPTAAERRRARYQASVEVAGADGSVVRSVLDTVNGYTFTPMAAAEAARRVLDGEHRPGFHTPAELFGNGFVETIADSRIVTL